MRLSNEVNLNCNFLKPPRNRGHRGFHKDNLKTKCRTYGALIAIINYLLPKCRLHEAWKNQFLFTFLFRGHKGFHQD